jgi:hypothetical protein
MIILLINLGCNYTVFAQSYPNSPTLSEGTNPPVVITQVELDSPFAFLSDNQTCTSPPQLGFVNNCLTDLVPGRKVQCAYFLGSSTCEPLHQYTSGTNKNCVGSQGLGNASAPQWFDMYNTQDKTIQLQYFDVSIPSTISSGITEAGPYSSIPQIGPHEKCTFAITPFDEPIALDQTNRTIIVSYDYDGKHYTTSTPKLTDIYNDSRTWQFDGNRWTFAEQNTVTVPEFPFAASILVAGIVSLIVLYQLKFRIK